MMGHSQSRFVIFLLFVLIAICVAAPPTFHAQGLQSDDYPIFADEPLVIPEDGADGPHEGKRAVFRMGKRAMMRFGKRAVMRFGKRSVFRLG